MMVTYPAGPCQLEVLRAPAPSSPEAPELISQVGGRLPLHCSGVGKVLLSHGGPELIETVLSGELRRYTS